jgi:hypothetical protein
MRTHWRLIVLLGAILSVICARAAGADPAGISRYDLRVDTEAKGAARVTLDLVLEHAAGETALVPFPFAEVQNLGLLEGPAGAAVALAGVNGQARILATLPGDAAGPVHLRLTGTVQKAISDPGPAPRTVRLSLLNTQPEPIRDLRIVITFPEGLRGHAIREARPAPGKAEAAPRAVLDAIDRRSGARLEVDSLSQGETAALRVELARAEPSLAWLLAGLLLGVTYLVSFRDLVRPPESKKEPS